jgi:hypothetical protein|tara:strand:+ start:12040 stop:12750 length:711 start_codon:yes stop_codon:yes gene_type:complete
MGLRNGDLRDLVNNVCEIDNYKSKMGDDEDIVVLSFSVSDINAAGDLVEFIERGFDFVLDADSTASELDNGSYKVFVEMERGKGVSQNIVDMIYGVGELADLKEFKFRYHKNFRSYDLNLDNLQEMLPIDPTGYTLAVTESLSAEVFFNKTPFETIEFVGESILLKKVYSDPIGFQIKDFIENASVNESITEKINVNDYPELIFLTKYLGDYNITKFGDYTLTLENNGHTLVAERL